MNSPLKNLSHLNKQDRQQLLGTCQSTLTVEEPKFQQLPQARHHPATDELFHIQAGVANAIGVSAANAIDPLHHL